MICNKGTRDGTNQQERHSALLKEGFVKIDERSQQDLIRFIHQFSDLLAYYNLNNQVVHSWQSIISELVNLDDFEPQTTQDREPHLGLLIVLTKLFAFSQTEINKIPEKHLNYYYKKILGIVPKEASPDEVQLVLELTKSNAFNDFLLKSDTGFDGGKDIQGRSLVYKTTREAIITRAKIQQIKSLFLDKDDGKTLIQVAPVANSLDGLGTPLTEERPYWPSFGESQQSKTLEERTMQEAEIGFAISDYILLLGEGHRTIELKIDFETNIGLTSLNSLTNALQILYSGEAAWETPISYTVLWVELAADTWQLHLTVQIGLAQPPFTFFNPEIHSGHYEPNAPVLKVLLLPEGFGYDTLKQLRIDQVHIDVEASQMKDHLLQNDTGILSPENPFLPFGSQPTLQSNLYIGNAEIFNKKLSEFTISLNWHDIPEASFANYYAAYGDTTTFNNSNFNAHLYMMLDRSWDHRLSGPVPIFDAFDANEPHEISVPQGAIDWATAGINYTENAVHEILAPINARTNRGFVKLTLTSPHIPFKAFGHKEFPQLYAERAIALATNTIPDPLPVLPNQPYTPILSELLIRYKAEKNLEIKANIKSNSLYQIGPFGNRPIDLLHHMELVPKIEEEGAMYIGFDGFEVPQSINLLFNIEEGTADVNVILEKEKISWHYLADNRWIELAPEEILVDETEGFKQSGIVSLVLPRGASNQNTYMPQGLIWIKATVSEGAAGANQLKAIFPNAVNAILETNNLNFDEHLKKPLLAESVSGMVVKAREIKNVIQPLNSNKGYPSEQQTHYKTRISERLRHKNRACLTWDYERIILEAFPEVFKIKCLPNTSPDSESDPGNVTLIVVSNLRNKQAVNLFEPRASILTLDAVKSYTEQYISPFIKVHSELPLYETILVEAKIGFMSGFDPGFYSTLLQQEIKQFLSPWAFEDGVDIEIGGAIYKSAILGYMESKPYVDFVVDFKMYHKGGRRLDSGISEMEIGLDFEVASPPPVLGIGEMVLGENFVVGEDVSVACATSPRSILVSALEHRIEALRPGEFVCEGASSLGIGFMTVNLDLLVD